MCPNYIEDECVEENDRAEAQTQDTQYKQSNTKETTLKILQLNIKNRRIERFHLEERHRYIPDPGNKTNQDTKDPWIYDRKKRQSTAEWKRER